MSTNSPAHEIVNTHSDRLPKLLRLQCAKTGVHAITKGGIHGSKYHGAYSVVLNGSYEDDVDEGETL